MFRLPNGKLAKIVHITDEDGERLELTSYEALRAELREVLAAETSVAVLKATMRERLRLQIANAKKYPQLVPMLIGQLKFDFWDARRNDPGIARAGFANYIQGRHPAIPLKAIQAAIGAFNDDMRKQKEASTGEAVLKRQYRRRAKARGRVVKLMGR